MTDIDETIQKLLDLKLATMAQAYRDLRSRSRPAISASSPRRSPSWSIVSGPSGDNRRLARLLRQAAHLTINDACLENAWCEPGRKPSATPPCACFVLATCQWIRKKHNVIVVGKTGVGKSYLGAALRSGRLPCNGLRAMCTRVPRLAHELA